MITFLNKISFRYLLKKGSNKLSSLSILTTLGVSIGIAVLITVVSVMNGFEDELRKRILGVIPHIVLEKKGGFISSKDTIEKLSLIHISEPTRPERIGDGVRCVKKK